MGRPRTGERNCLTDLRFLQKRSDDPVSQKCVSIDRELVVRGGHAPRLA